MKYNICMSIETAAMMEIEAANENEAKELAVKKIRDFLNTSKVAVFACDEFTNIDVYDWDEAVED